MVAYYNEIDKNAVNWLRQLISDGLIADGIVDDRSILEVQPADLKGFSQHHFFAGIGGWSLALRQAGWADTKPIWTASLPCQPFSVAGTQKGKNDDRHLLPHYLDLVKQCRPHIQIGEQVPGAIKHRWLDDLYNEMERENYAVGAVILTAAGAGKAHIRQRLYWMSQIRMGNSERNGFNEDTLRHSISQGEKESRMRQSKRSNTEQIEWIECRDAKYRPIKSGITSLVNGVSGGVVHSGDTLNPNNSAEALAIRIKGYGNAICIPSAKLFINAVMST